MKIFIFIYIFVFAFEQFLSSPITEQDIKAHGNLPVMLNLSLKSPNPKIDNVNKVNSKIGIERKEILVAAAKSTEIAKHATDEHKDSNVENEKKSLNNGANSQMKNDLGNLSKNKKTESLHDQNFERHEEIKATPSSLKKHETKSNEKNLNEKFSDSTTNEKSSEKREKDNLNKIINKPKKGVGLKSGVSQQNSNKTDLQKKDDSIIINSSVMIISVDKKATKNNLENIPSKNTVSGKLDMKNSGTISKKNFKGKRNISKAVQSAIKEFQITFKASKKDSQIQNKASNLIEDITKKYQNNFTQKQNSNFGLISENKTTNMTSGESATAVKIPSMTSSSNNHKHQDNSPAKETEKSSDKVKSRESDRAKTENNLKQHFTSTTKQIDSVAKLVQADGKKSEEKKPNIFTTIKNAVNNDHKKI